MKRREFLGCALGAVGASLATAAAVTASPKPKRGPFKLKYAPHFGMFRHHAEDLLDQIKFMADQGFSALEDNGMAKRPVELQEKIAAEMQRQGFEMGVFVATGDFKNVTFASPKKEESEKILGEMRKAVEVAKRVHARWCTVVPGCFSMRVDWDYQTAHVIENLKRAAEICEKGELVMVLEPLNPRDHPGLFLTKISQAHMICRAVGSPACKILDDLYHQQVSEGNLIPNLDRAWSEIGYFQVGDNPGRKEPDTGEINYKNIFRHLHQRNFTGIVGMEHGNSKPGKEGELAVIEAYRRCDSY